VRGVEPGELRDRDESHASTQASSLMRDNLLESTELLHGSRDIGCVVVGVGVEVRGFVRGKHR
jgi:hypothetical protein